MTSDTQSTSHATQQNTVSLYDLTGRASRYKAAAFSALEKVFREDVAAAAGAAHERMPFGPDVFSCKDALDIPKMHDLALLAIEAVATKDTIVACRRPTRLEGPYAAAQKKASVDVIRPHFDHHYYSVHNPDLPQTSNGGLSPSQLRALEEHFVAHGIWEGRSSAPNIDYRAYLHRYIDLIQAFGPDDLGSSAEHYAAHGCAEGRNAAPFFAESDHYLTLINDIEPEFYLNTYDDLRHCTRDLPAQDRWTFAKNHFLSCGLQEGRSAHADISFPNYLRRYEDLSRAFGEDNYSAAANHWYTFGRFEGRQVGP